MGQDGFFLAFRDMKNKIALATIAIGDTHRTVYEDLTKPRMQEYAKKIGAEFIERTTTQLYPPHFAKYELIQELHKANFFQVCYVDADVYIRENAPNIFNAHKTSALFSEVPHPRPAWLGQSITWIRENLDPQWPENRYYNTGVMVLDYFALHLLARALKNIDPMRGMFFEQDQLNVVMRDVNMPIAKLHRCWNQFCGPNWRTPEKLKEAFFIHGCGLGSATQKYDKFKQIIEEYP